MANADQMVIVCALADPAPRLRFVDRCLVAAYDAGLDPLLVLTKSDLASPRKVRAFYRPLGLPMISTRQPLPAQTLTRLRRALDGRVSVLIGQSGVGKSTLVNELVPDADRAVGDVNPVTGRGRHTSSSAIAAARCRAPAAAGGLTPSRAAGWLAHRHPWHPRLRAWPRHGGSRRGGIRGPRRGNRRTARRAATTCPRAAPSTNGRPTHQAEARLDSLRRLLRSRDATD